MSYSQANELLTRIQQDMRQAMRDRDTVKLNVLRSLSTQLSNAEAVQESATLNIGVGSTEVSRRQLTFEDARQIIDAELREIESTLDAIDETSDYADELRQKAVIVRAYLA